jgi:hypothetical protein
MKIGKTQVITEGILYGLKPRVVMIVGRKAEVEARAQLSPK